MTEYQLEAYNGTENYIFVSYAHKDSNRVFPIIRKLNERGYRIWYDEGIVPGSEWPENIALHLNDSAVVIAFVSPNFMDSLNCRREINFALSKQKPLLSVILEPTQMPLGMEMQLSAQQSVLRDRFPSEGKFIEKICAWPEMKHCKPMPEGLETMEELELDLCSVQPEEPAAPQPQAEVSEPLPRQKLRGTVSHYGNIAASVTSGAGALMLMVVTVLLFASYHQENLAAYTSFGPFPDWIGNMLPGLWRELPQISSPDYWKMENYPAIAWLVAAGWFLKTAGCAYKRHIMADVMVRIAAVLRYVTIAGHIALCAYLEQTVQQGVPQWEIWLPYYFPAENLVAFAFMIAAGCAVGRAVNWITLKIIDAVLERIN